MMKHSKMPLLFLLPLAACAHAGAVVQVAEPKVVFEAGSSKLLLPADLTDFLDQAASLYEIASDKDFSPEMLEALRKENPDFVPYFCAGDFDADGAAEYILMLRGKFMSPQNKGSPLQEDLGRIVVIDAKPGDGYSASTITDFPHFDMAFEVFVRTVKTGEGKPDRIEVGYWRAKSEMFGFSGEGYVKLKD